MTFDRTRIALLAVGVACLAAAIGVRLYVLQIERSDVLRDRADDQSRRTIRVDARRGAIVDRHGESLAVSLATHQLYAHPPRVDDPRSLATRLAPLLGVPRATLQRRLASDAGFVFLDRFCEPETVDALRAAGLELDGTGALGLLPSSRRHYPHGRLAAHVIGAVNVDGVGLEGVEIAWDEQLRGDPTEYLVILDGKKRSGLRETVSPPRRPAHDVVLTIDAVLQHVVERELDLAMAETGAISASAILLDPETGEVLALANRPTVDLNAFGDGGDGLRRNRAVVDRYEPGSTFKIVSMAAALEHGAVRPEQRFDCENGRFRYGKRPVRDSSPHDVLTAREIFALSSNIGMVKIAERMPDRELRDTIVAFGFGQPTGIGLPGEIAGVVHPLDRWVPDNSKGSIAFGHEVSVTALQMVAATAAIANRGVLVPPRIVGGLRRDRDRLVSRRPTAGRRAVGATTARTLVSMMEQVVTDGTGTKAAVDGWRLAGKTGTAQKIVDGRYSETEYVASFAGFGPVRSPRLAGIVVLDAPRGQRHQGGVVAAPVFRRIMTDALRHLRVPPDDPQRVVAPLLAGDTAIAAPGAATRQRAAGVVRGRVPDLRGVSLRRAVAMLADAGLRWEVVGRGVVVDQAPAPGTTLETDSICRLTLGEPVERRASADGAALASWRGAR